MIGLGVLLGSFSGDVDVSKACYLKRITSAALVDNKLGLAFEDDTMISVTDDGHLCCESRYVTTDDDVQSLVGHRLMQIVAKEGPDQDKHDEYCEPGCTDDHMGCHETMFVEIQTDDGSITLVTHNEHNGYYGGFDLEVKLLKGPEAPTF